VQTGGFGDPNGIPGEGKAGAKLMAHALGSFDLPSGSGNGNGTGGAQGARTVVASTGFGNDVATGGSPNSNGRIVQGSGFADPPPVAEDPSRTSRRASPGPATETPVQILVKPKPVYTEEARRLRVEGEALLEVTFSASGECRVIRVVRGLGYGLNEAAVQAAQQINFRPAMRNGQPVDSTAIVHVVFQLAY
jgi:TonB family protein